LVALKEGRRMVTMKSCIGVNKAYRDEKEAQPLVRLEETAA
jgi:hypothetical protein